MTILCIVLMIFSLAVLAAFQHVTEKSNKIIQELNRTLEINQNLNARKEMYKDLVKSLREENKNLSAVNQDYRQLIETQANELQSKGESQIDTDELEVIHIELDNAVSNLRDYLSSIECTVEDVESQLQILDSLL